MEKHERCACGARIAFVRKIKLDDGRVWHHFKCGICGSVIFWFEEIDEKST